MKKLKTKITNKSSRKSSKKKVSKNFVKPKPVILSKGIHIGFDPGTKLGWCVNNNGVLSCGTFQCKFNKKKEGYGMRYVKLYDSVVTLFLDLGLPGEEDAYVSFEDVRRHRGTDAAHVYGAVVGIIMMICEQFGVPYQKISVGAAKKRATGLGKTDGKTPMVDAANREFGLSIPHTEDDTADAVWIMVCGMESH